MTEVNQQYKIEKISNFLYIFTHVDFHTENNLFCKKCSKILTLSSFDNDAYNKFGVCEKCAYEHSRMNVNYTL